MDEWIDFVYLVKLQLEGITSILLYKFALRPSLHCIDFSIQKVR
jgi:hypothetical protein